MDIVSEIQTRLPPCGHQICLDCSKSYIKQLIDSNKVTGFFISLISDWNIDTQSSLPKWRMLWRMEGGIYQITPWFRWLGSIHKTQKACGN